MYLPYIGYNVFQNYNYDFRFFVGQIFKLPGIARARERYEIEFELYLLTSRFIFNFSTLEKSRYVKQSMTKRINM